MQKAGLCGHKATTTQRVYFLVEILNGRYKGQKLTAAVNRKITPKTTRMFAAIPSIVPVSFNVKNTSAIMIRRIRSMDPMFAFMILCFVVSVE